MTDWRMEILNDVKCIINGKDCYIDGKILKTDMRYIPELQEARRTKVVVGGVNCDMSNPCCASICYTCCNTKNEY
jgi:hypothetical protein